MLENCINHGATIIMGVRTMQNTTAIVQQLFYYRVISTPNT
ncbi:hypothetical protein APHNP_0420 [Anaplasma phagocytophilum str. ApNP]|uniref:Uncharacterized protein n=2 Tax=Anaplasma phagocytophilum TaxID=948 RepID=A0A0F3NI34_ANAPH|nr:hypothetical protein APHMUC_0619 [Anaplasma phagocytophilum str. ApMUC09]KJV67670.1 hypothetical protein APHNP_0420 [Anaplasma phagocytophilum str. ApNP]